MTEILLSLVALLLIAALSGGVYAYRQLTGEAPSGESGPSLEELQREAPSEDEDFRFRRTGPDDREVVEGITQVLQIDVRVKPLSYGEYRSYDGFGQPVMKWSSDDQARLLREHLVAPDLSEELSAGERLDGKVLEEEFEAFEVVDLIQAVVTYSGLHRYFRGNGSGKAGKLRALARRSRSKTPASGSSDASTASDTATSESGVSTT